MKKKTIQTKKTALKLKTNLKAGVMVPPPHLRTPGSGHWDNLGLGNA